MRASLDTHWSGRYRLCLSRAPVERHASEMITALRTLGITLSVVILAPLSFCVALPIGLNEVKAVNWGRQYGRMPHPPGTERILLHQGIDKLSNGDNCDFMILEARSYPPGQEASILAFYAEREDPLDPHSNPLRPTFSVGGGSPATIEPYATFNSELARVHEGPYYELEVWHVVESAPPLIDWRCP